MAECSLAERAKADPTLCQFDLPLRRRYFPFGFPLDLETNSPDVIAAANEGWGQFSAAFEETPMHVALGVTTSDTLPELDSSFRCREHLMSMICDSENSMVFDFHRGFAFGWVTRAVAADHPFLRYRFLLPSLELIAQRALAGLHGALMERNGCGVLLCGDSMAGKSTLAYASARAGWTYIGDDMAYIVRNDPGRYVVGDPYSIRFREGALALFPELAWRLPAVRPNGKIALEVLTRELPIKTAAACSVDHVVFVNRQEHERPRLRQYPKDRALEAWAVAASIGTEQVRAAQMHSYQRLLGAGIWELTYSHFEDAIARLERLVDTGS
jgi:hypothetical protein